MAPADCGTDHAANDADNYACEGGLCRWTGCTGDAECAETFGASYTCGAPSGELSYCVPRCQQAEDCALDDGTYSADNYVCDDGACRWLGCHSSGECLFTYQSSKWVCADL